MADKALLGFSSLLLIMGMSSAFLYPTYAYIDLPLSHKRVFWGTVFVMLAAGSFGLGITLF